MQNKEEYDGYAIKGVIRHVCETIRAQTHWLVNMQLPQNKKIKDIRKIMSFTWENEVTKPAQTKEQMKAVMRAIATSFKNKKRKNKKA